MDDRQRAAGTSVAALRLGYGVAVAVAPRVAMRVQFGGDPQGPYVWLARMFGVRDAVLGAGALLAGTEGTRRSWVAAGAVADAIDVVTALAGARHIGRLRSVGIAALAATATATGTWSLAE